MTRHDGCVPPSTQKRGQRFLLMRLRRALFLRLLSGFVLTMVLTAAAVFAYHATIRAPEPWRDAPHKVGAFLAARFEPVWHDEARREALAREIADTFALGVSLYDGRGGEVFRAGPPCKPRAPRFSGAVRSGRVVACVTHPGGAPQALGAFLVGALGAVRGHLLFGATPLATFCARWCGWRGPSQGAICPHVYSARGDTRKRTCWPRA